MLKQTAQVTLPPIARDIWDMKYRHKDMDGNPIDNTVQDTWWRVAKALANPEKPEGREYWTDQFYNILDDYKFLPAGRILNGAGTTLNVTLFNCFVMGAIEDSIEGIYQGVKEAATTLQAGGGVGMNFSTLRPKGAKVHRINADASGPLSFMDSWDVMCKTMKSSKHRRGAMMSVLSCDHPDIEAFVEAKRDPQRFRNFNLSVLVTDKFIEHVRADLDWILQFDGVPYKKIMARNLWDHILKATYEVAEPGVIFIDRINKANNLYYAEHITGTNPCGEQPLPPYGACLLGSINLTRFVTAPFDQKGAKLDFIELKHTTEVAVRMLDNVIEESNYPLPQQEKEAKSKRRIGIGVTGLADALAMCCYRYGSEQGAYIASRWLEVIEEAAYKASAKLAIEKGAFPLFRAEDYCKGRHIQKLSEDTQHLISKTGIRNSHLTSIAPTGTISLFAGNVSSGVEPIFAFEYERKVTKPDGSMKTGVLEDHAVFMHHKLFPGVELPSEFFVTAQDLTPVEHIRMLEAVQQHVDSSVSKTVNVPETISFEDFKAVYDLAYDSGLKCCATYRPNEVTGSILSLTSNEAKPSHQNLLPAVINGKLPEREPVLDGKTYKVKGHEHAMYVTINDTVENSEHSPYEIFVNTKNVEHQAWTVALTRMISAIWRRGGDVSFVAPELKAVYDPRGGAYIEGKYVPSAAAAIGNVIERHMNATSSPQRGQQLQQANNGPPLAIEHKQANVRQCPQCGDHSLVREAGCDVCKSCGYDKCG